MSGVLPPTGSPCTLNGLLNRLWKLKYYLVVLGLIILLFAHLWDDPDSDVRYQALVAVFLGGISIGICACWANGILQCAAGTTAYIKGTTTSRTLLVFWVLLIGSTAVAGFLGKPQLFVPLTEGMLGTFAGFGSIILTAGPAYKEYKEAIAPSHTTQAAEPAPVSESSVPAASASGVHMLPVLASIATCTVILASRRRTTRR